MLVLILSVSETSVLRWGWRQSAWRRAPGPFRCWVNCVFCRVHCPARRARAPIAQKEQSSQQSEYKCRWSPGQSFSSRILWEHTRGRYSCLQCGHSTPTRQEMTAHIEGQHRSPAGRAQTDTDNRGSPPFQPKISLETETAVYTQLWLNLSTGQNFHLTCCKCLGR